MSRNAASLLALFLGVAGCSSGPPVRIFVLTPPLTPAVALTPPLRSPSGSTEQLEVRRVLVPDYLDTTDILLREGRNEVKPSSTGRWGERLSEGLTHALAAELAVRLPSGSVVLDASSKPQRQLLINVQALDLWPDGRCVLAASWSIVNRDPPRATATGSGSFDTAPAAGGFAAGDARLVEAVARTVRKLADAIDLRELPPSE
jgi:uncharacterized lipoprotein YmbA